MGSAKSAKPARRVAKKSSATTRAKPTPTRAAPPGPTVHVRLAPAELEQLDAEVARRQSGEPAADVSRASVIRYLVRGLPAAAATRSVKHVVSRFATLSPSTDEIGRYEDLAVAGLCHRFRWIEAGMFRMGSPLGEAGRYEDEGPAHEVTLTRGYWIGEAPVTQALYEAVMGTNPSRFRGGDHPVEMVSWEEAHAFIVKLNELVPGLGARLPSEAEWEMACRGGTTGATWVGELDLSSDGVRASILDPIAVYYGNGTLPVKSKAPNRFGLYDMLGNVWEWCEDRWGSYEVSAVTDPKGPDGPMGASRVIRGGSWVSSARFVRAAYRCAFHPGYRLDYLGLRLARGPAKSDQV
jgi:formylglycine-generating enzyme